MAMSLVARPILVEEYVETSKQITKALKCVAFTNMQVGDMMLRKRERLEKRIFSISEEIELLQADVAENIVNQRERRQQLTDIEEDVERAEVLGNALMVEELLTELQVLQDEGKREEALLRSIKKALRSRRRVQKTFVTEKKSVEDEMRSFNRKQNLIQALLTTFAKDSVAAGSNSQSSSASQSDCGSDLDDSLLSMGVDDTKSEPIFNQKRRPSALKSSSVMTTRPRRWSADGTYPLTPSPPRPKTRARRSLSVTFSPVRPHSLGSVEEEDDDDETVVSDQQRTDVTADQVFKSVDADATEELLVLEEIHDEQDNFYSHASDSSDHSDTGDSGSEVEDEDDVHDAEMVAAVVVVSKASSDKKGLVEMHTLVLDDEEDTVSATTTTTTTTTASSAMTTLSSIVKSSNAFTKSSRDQVEVTLAAHTSEAMVIEELTTVAA